MADPVVHFEIIGTDPEGLREFYRALYGWEFATPSPVATEVSDADQYGFLDVIQAADGAGIRGGVGGGAGFAAHAVFYVGVPEVAVALERAEALGGTRLMGPATSPNGLVVAHFRDLEGTVVGLAGPA
jgi:predicted enzyme related to lactoylglutathione lyase